MPGITSLHLRISVSDVNKFVSIIHFPFPMSILYLAVHFFLISIELRIKLLRSCVKGNKKKECHNMEMRIWRVESSKYWGKRRGGFNWKEQLNQWEMAR